MDIICLIIFFILGTVLGSIYTVIGLRLPKDEPTTLKYYCENCLHELKSLDIIPLISYIFLKGRCRYCHKKIDIQELLMELFSGILFAVAFYSFGFSLELLIALGIISLLIIIMVSDLTYLIIPDEVLIFFSLYFILVQYAKDGLLGVGMHIATGIFLFVLMYAIMVLGEKALKKESLGGGDVKLMFLFGLVLDPLLGTLTIFLGSIFALPMSFYLLYKNKEKVIPFGPFLLMAFAFMYFTKLTPDILLNWLGF